MADLDTRDELQRLLRDFYDRALADPLLRHVFVDVVDMDLEAHLPRITDFWQKVLFGTGDYDGQTMAVHRRVHLLVPLTSAHFERWLDLWRDAVAEHHAGPVAERAVAHAERMAAVFLRNLLEPRQPGRSLPVVARSSGGARQSSERFSPRRSTLVRCRPTRGAVEQPRAADAVEAGAAGDGIDLRNRRG